MAAWDAEQYLQFKSQRTQPAIDLANRIRAANPHTVLDIGCGPGNSTHVLKTRFPHAHILGIDNSETMIAKATATYPNLAFKLMSVDEVCHDDAKYDVIFSNACLQWVPNHREVLPLLFGRLRANGVLAVQVPINTQEPLFKIIKEIVHDEKWGFPASLHEQNSTLSGDEYFDLLSSLTDNFDIWETVYYHTMPSIQAMVEWVKGTRLLPYTQALGKTDAQRLIDEITERAATVYQKQANGAILFRFRRLFFTATR
ncbi:MAG: methyltransferase domain-containing protein [Treponema sp.]|nr:methyltransferase domain-containing protein [Treponema sp.]